MRTEDLAVVRGGIRPGVIGVSLLGAMALVAIAGARPQASLDHVPGVLIVRFRAAVPLERRAEILRDIGAGPCAEIPQIGVQLVKLPAEVDEEDCAQGLRAQSEVEYAELNRRVPQAELHPNDPLYAYQPMDAQIYLPTAWSTTTGSAGVTIAILDGGVDASHPDIADNIVPGWNFYDNSPDTDDIDGHGTKAAGTAAAVGNNSKGVAGCAWNSKIMPIRTSSPTGKGEVFAISQGLVWAADHGARIANVGYDLGDTTNSAVSTAAQYFQSRGGVVTSAAGNNGQVLSRPNDPYILTVSAITQFNGITSWSNTGTHVDLSAPEASYSTVAGGGYGQALGTSYSASFVAGVAALVLSVEPSLTGAQLQDLLLQTSDDLGPGGWDPGYGWGRLNAARAVSTALGTGGDKQPPSVEVTSPKDQDLVKGNITIRALATDNVAVTRVEFYVDGNLLGVDKSRPFSCSWAAKSSSKGPHAIACKAYDPTGNLGTSPTITVYR